MDAEGAPTGEAVVFPHLIGAHWAGAILAALTVAVRLGANEREALERLRGLRPLPGRMRQIEGADGLTLLDDSHNASPASARAGLEALAASAAGTAARGGVWRYAAAG